MAVTVKLKYLRHSARKLEPVAKMFRGKNLERSIEETSLMPQDSATYLNKALKMAKAAATAKEFDADKMIISAISATTGPKIKRIRPNARGRTNRYIKHLAHVQVTVEQAPEKPVKAKKVAKKETE